MRVVPDVVRYDVDSRCDEDSTGYDEDSIAPMGITECDEDSAKCDTDSRNMMKIVPHVIVAMMVVVAMVEGQRWK